MKWFKHISDSLDDPFIQDLLDEFGAAGYLVFFGALEIISREFSTKSPGKVTLKSRFFRRKVRLSWNKCRTILKFCEKNHRIFIKEDGDRITLNCPKLKNLCDEYTQKKLKEISGQHPDSIGSDSDTETDTDKEVETDKEQRTQNPPFLKPDNKHFEHQVGEYFEGIKNKCAAILKLPAKKGRPFNPFEWIQEKVNKARHPGAMDETFQAMIDGWDGIDNPYGYANSILKTTNPNWIEKDNIIKSKEKWLIIKDKMAETFKGIEIFKRV